jgi:hypothetical protein
MNGSFDFMKRTNLLFHCLIMTCVLVLYATAVSLQADELSESDKYFLRGYEKMRAALVADDLTKANEAAQELTESGFQVARAETLGFARDEFTKLSKLAVKIAAGQAGYYIMHCPVLDKDWVQTSKEVSNPYGGKEMISCGEIKH